MAKYGEIELSLILRVFFKTIVKILLSYVSWWCVAGKGKSVTDTDTYLTMYRDAKADEVERVFRKQCDMVSRNLHAHDMMLRGSEMNCTVLCSDTTRFVAKLCGLHVRGC